MFELYKRVPLDRDKNLAYRVRLRDAATEIGPKGEWNRRCIMEACKRDPLFFFSALCWLYEPRPRLLDGVRQPMTFPFIVWPHQMDAINEIYADRDTGDPRLGFDDIVCEKSRGEGMSWIGILMALHSWLFEPYSKIGIVSRTEEAADDPEDSDSLGWKVDWEMTQLPLWMVGKRNVDWKRVLDRHTWTNKRNGAMIKASAATGDVFRGGRLTWALMDEFAFFKKGEDAAALNASHGATDSRLFVSTVNGQHNEYHRVAHDPATYKVIIDWKQNVSRNRGLYKMEKGLPVTIDPDSNPLPKHYDPPTEPVLDLISQLRQKGFKLEGKLRSPWYDKECNRPGMTPKRIAQELDRDYAGSESVVFGHEFKAAVAKTVKRPFHSGRFTVLEDVTSGELQLKVQFETLRGGDSDLWLPLDAIGRPPRGNYLIASDVSTGQGGSHTSNSTLVGINIDTKEQVLGIASNTISPADWADLSVGLCNWLWGAYLGWEHNGPGSAFTKRLKTLMYGNVYMRKVLDRKGRNRGMKSMGWWTDEKTKPAMFDEMARAVRHNDIAVRCEKLQTEFGQYIYDGQGRIIHAESGTTDDNASAGKAHGDRVIALGVGCQMLLDRPSSIMTESNQQGNGRKPPVDTMASRMLDYADEDRGKRKNPDRWRGSVLSGRD